MSNTAFSKRKNNGSENRKARAGAPGTGYSRVRPDLTKKFYNVPGIKETVKGIDVELRRR